MKIEQIDTSTTAGKAEVMRLADQGRTVVWRERGDAQWRRGPMPEWDWTSAQYAIIAEPAGPDEMWVTFGHGGFVLATHAERPPVLLQDAPNARATTVRYVRADQ